MSTLIINGVLLSIYRINCCWPYKWVLSTLRELMRCHRIVLLFSLVHCAFLFSLSNNTQIACFLPDYQRHWAISTLINVLVLIFKLDLKKVCVRVFDLLVRSLSTCLIFLMKICCPLTCLNSYKSGSDSLLRVLKRWNTWYKLVFLSIFYALVTESLAFKSIYSCRFLPCIWC